MMSSLGGSEGTRRTTSDPAEEYVGVGVGTFNLRPNIPLG